MAKGKITTIMSVLLLGPVFALADWELQQDEDGIQVFTKALADSDFDAFRAETTLETNLSAIMAVHFDVAAVKDWMKNCDASRLLSEEISAEGYTAYFKTDSPWPVDDRDYTLTYQISQNPSDAAVTLSFTTVTGLLPENEDAVRVQQLDGFWKMTPLPPADNSASPRIKIVYQVSADPAGDIPAWLANSFAVEQPFESLQKLRQQVKMEKYQNRDFSFIKDPSR